MSKEVKITDEEMDQIKSIRDGFDTLTVKFGQVEMELSNLNKTKQVLETQFFDVKAKEQEIIKSITDKYGDGELDVNTGVFVAK
jgi:helix-turn-helix protein